MKGREASKKRKIRPRSLQHRKSFSSNTWVLAGATLLAAALLFWLLSPLPRGHLTDALYDSERGAAGERAEQAGSGEAAQSAEQQRQQSIQSDGEDFHSHDTTPLELWEPDYSSHLWRREISSQLTEPPFLYRSENALVNRVTDGATEFRVLMFDDQSGEVQGAVQFEGRLGKARPDVLVLEYVSTMATACAFNTAVDCQSTGNILSLGLGAGSLVNFARYLYPKMHVDVAEISEDIKVAATQYLGVEEGPLLDIHMVDAGKIFEHVPPTRKYEFIFKDAYIEGPSVPPHLLKDEFLSTLSSRLSSSGVLIFNFCTPYYKGRQAKLDIVDAFRRHFRHVHNIEATIVSEIIVAYNHEHRVSRDRWRDHWSHLQAQCRAPHTTRGVGYEQYLSDPGWENKFMRNLHLEVSTFYCLQGRLTAPFCKWHAESKERIAQQVRDY